MDKHLFITITPTHIIFRDNDTFGEDPAKTDTDKLNVIIKIIKYYGQDATVEIRDDRN